MRRKVGTPSSLIGVAIISYLMPNIAGAPYKKVIITISW